MGTIKNISIIGAGNIGIAVAVDLSTKDDVNITLLTSKVDKLKSPFIKTDTITGETITGKNISVTDDYYKALTSCDLCIITVPTFLIKDCLEKVSLYNPKAILFEPGYGGKEFFCKKLIEKGCIIAGLERVTHISRLYEPTKVRASKKKELNLACLDSSHTKAFCSEIEYLFDIKCNPVPNYLTVTFTPSNPILHTSRLYSLFKDIDFNTPVSRQIEFYNEWNDESSEQLFKMDTELQSICCSFDGIDLSGVISLPKYYESNDIEALTKKLISIPSFKGILAPLRSAENCYYLDLDSRYFREDFLHGLSIIKAFSLISNTPTPNIDEVLKWYERISGEQLWDKNGMFKGKALENAGIPQNFGINTLDDVISFYKA